MNVIPSTQSARKDLLTTYQWSEQTFVEGDGCWLTADDGRRYLDFAAGIAVVALGHRHPDPLRAAHQQLDRLWHTSNLYWTEPMANLAERLSGRFGGARAFFCNSGAEAVESAIKYARKRTGRPGIVAMSDSFHGRTMGALSVTGQPKKQTGFGPLLPGVSFARLNDASSAQSLIGEETALVIVEPIQGESGIRPADPDFLQTLARLTHQAGAMLCFDEIQTGVGRTGSFFAFEQLDVLPDMVTLAKGLANGLPIGSLLVAEDEADGFSPGDHGTTFGGNPVICAAATAVCDAMTDSLLAAVRSRGERLATALADLPAVAEVRGRGLLIGCELGRPVQSTVRACVDAGLLVTSAGETTLRLTPPLVVTEEEVDRALGILGEVLS